MTRWATQEEALGLLTHAGERDLVAGASPPP
jgi:hypothetical protein